MSGTQPYQSWMPPQNDPVQIASPISRTGSIVLGPQRVTTTKSAQALRRKSLNTTSLVLPSPAPSDEGNIDFATTTGQSIYVDGRDNLSPDHETVLSSSSLLEHSKVATQEPSNKRSRKDAGATSSTPQTDAPQPPPYNPYNELQKLAYTSMQRFVQSYGGQRNISPKEWSRISLLQEASMRTPQDIFYLVVHQILSVAYLGAAHLPSSVKNISNLGRALQMLNELLAPLQDFDQQLTDFFACFPGPINKMVNWSKPYASAMTQVINFLKSMVRNYMEFERRCRNRNAPPLVEELVEVLGLSSPTLQRVFFIAILRRTWTDAFAVAEPTATAIFRENQSEYTQNMCSLPLLETSFSGRRNSYLRAYAKLYGSQAQAVAMHPMGHVSGQIAHPQSAFVPGIQPRAGGSQSRQNPHLRIDTGYMPQPGPVYNSPYSAQARPEHFLQRSQVQSHAMQSQQILVNQAGHASFHNARRSSALTPNHASTMLNPNGPMASHQAPTPGAMASWGPHATLRSDNPTRMESTTTLMRPHFFSPPNASGAQVTPPDPDRYAIHLAHLRSPVLRVSETAPNTRLYQYVTDFAMKPTQYPDIMSIHEWHFNVSDDDFLALPSESNSSEGAPPTRLLSEDCRIYRLRCVMDLTSLDINKWVVAETKWPSDMYFSFNGFRLHPRKKLHNGRDLAIDITSRIQKAKNTIKVFSNKRKDAEQLDYVLAVEIVGLKNHADVKAEIVRRVVPADEVKTTIIASLTSRAQTAPDTTDDDDDITVISNTLTISLMDPYKGIEMFDIPARGATCSHRNCFDLETFLNTRPSKAAGEPTRVDEWRCPICGADARPCSLVVDGYLAEVRDVLKAVGQLDTARAILVGDDGAWRVKNEETVSREPKGRGKDGPEGSGTKTKQVDIVDLEMD